MNKRPGRPQTTRGVAPKRPSGSKKTYGETSREARFDKPRSPRSAPRSEGYANPSKPGRSRTEGRTEKPFFDKPFRNKSTEQGESRGFKSRTRDTDQGFSRDRKYEPRDSSTRGSSLGDKGGYRGRPDRDDQGSAPKRRYEPRDSSTRSSSFGDKGGYRGRPDRDDQGSAPKRRYEPRDSSTRSSSFDDKGGYRGRPDRGDQGYAAPKRKYEPRDGEDRKRSYDDSKTPNKERSSTSRQHSRQENKFEKPTETRKSNKDEDDSMRLNRFIATSGICSRREADTLISSGVISVNGEIVTELGTKVKPTDTVLYGDQRLKNEKKVYLLLNKPKDFITTSDDPMERKTVMDLVQNACPERVYPVGRLDRNTTGILLLTNDGDLAKKLTHPKHGVMKLYQVTLNKPLTSADLNEIKQGIKIDDILVVPDEISYIENNDNKKEVGIAIHSGQNRVVRRMFEHFNYNVEKLDRVMFAGLTKKDLPRGKYRFLSPKEVGFLKMVK